MLNLINAPVAVWYIKEDKSISHITYGWEEFYNKIRDEKLPLQSIENTSWLLEKDKESFGFNIKENIFIGKYEVIDGLKSVYHKLKILDNTFDLSNFCLTVTANKLKVFTPKDYPLETIDLFFTANEKYHNNIINGKQPLRSSKYYRKPFKLYEGTIAYIDDNQTSMDKLEALSSLVQAKEIKEPLYNNGYVKNVDLQKLPFDSHLFSLHDKYAAKEEIKKFGKNTYKINNIHKWIELINNEVVAYWTNKRSDFIGTFIMFGKVEYDDTSKFVTEINTFNELSNHDITGYFKNPEVTRKVDGLDVIIKEIEKNIFEDCKKYIFTKPNKYMKESEHRLCIVPFYSNKYADGLLDFYLEDNIIEMDINHYNQVITLLNC